MRMVRHCQSSLVRRQVLAFAAPCAFPVASVYDVGPTACTPERSGLIVNFSEFSIGPADLHDLS
jgi:regulation of enolase protein 1 (concanavalin A-like superfamily)